MSAIQRKRPASTSKREPESRSVSSEPPKSGGLFMLAFNIVTWGIVLFFVSSFLITDSWTWGYRGKWVNVNTWIPKKQIELTEQELAKYDGTNPSLPVYIAIDGEVFDVTKGKGWYTPGGSYHFFAGRDAARAYATGCFKEHLTHDLRGLGEHQLKSIEHWKKFYDNHHNYFKIGTVKHVPIDPKSPIPASCDKAMPQKPKRQQDDESKGNQK
ncbi:cytochrome b5-like heme/steroid binding domain-containing protein [Umbelopsis sp. AD052]|nr:cytochrome b5-like heme/steroid binding domain-containing protein [Umbelopsis sp. AD052]